MKTSPGILLWMVFSLLACSGDDTGERIEAVEFRVPAIEIDFRTGIDWSVLGQIEGSGAIEERMEHYRVPGVGIAVVDDYRVEWSRGYGVLVAGEENPVTEKTRFEAASSTKMVTAVAVLHYMKMYGLGLDQNPEDVMRGWRFPESEYTREEPINIRRLLSHTAGINRPDGGFSFEEGGALPSLVDVLNGTAPATNQPLAMEFVPGERNQYSNMGYLVLQKMLMDVTNMSFPELMDEALFAPLDMEASGFELELPADEVPRPHDPEGMSYEPGLHPSAFAQGGLRTTPGNLASLVAEIMKSYQGTSEAILPSTTTRTALSPEIALDPAGTMGFTGQGLGFFLMDSDKGVVFTHPGFNTPGATCMLLAFPETGQAAVVMTNGARGLELSIEILSAIAAEYEWPTIGANGEG